MNEKTKKRRFICWIPVYLLIIAAVVLMCLFIPTCQNKKETPTIDYKLDVICNNVVINDSNALHNHYTAGEEAAILFTAEDGFKLPEDVDAKIGYRQLVKGVDYTYSKNTGAFKLKIEGDTSVTVTAVDRVLNDYSWSEIKEISKSGKASEVFHIGDEKIVMVNNQPHRTRIIGFNQDYIDETKKEETKIGITFEFVNAISDENGLSLVCYWNDTNDTSKAHYDFKNSTARAVLVGEGNAAINWFQFFGYEHDADLNRHFSANYSGKSVLSMLPDDLVNVLETPSKYVNIFNTTSNAWKEEVIKDKLFLLSPRETGNKYAQQETSTFTYEFYKKPTDDMRMRLPVNWHNGTRTNWVEGKDVDGAYTGEKHITAGWSNANLGETGGSWFRSPRIGVNDGRVWFTGNLGGVYNGQNTSYNRTRVIAPGFCI